MKNITGTKTEKYVTEVVFERAMVSIQKSFNEVNENIADAFGQIQAELQIARAERKEDRQTMSALSYNDVKQGESIDDLQERMIRLEPKK